MSRQEFLQNHWSPYPQSPLGTCAIDDQGPGGPMDGEWWAGRLVDFIAEGNSVCVSLMGGGAAAQLLAPEWRLIGVDEARSIAKKTFPPEGILRRHDQVACRKNGSVIEVILLAPALAPPLELDLTMSTAKLWMEFLRLIREFFVAQNFLEVQTPTLVAGSGLEPHLEPFFTRFVSGADGRDCFLPTSPELHLKKVLSANWPRVFEVRQVFRNGEVTEHHQPEFSLLEWYRLYRGSSALVDDLQALLSYLNLKCLVKEGLKPISVTTVRALFLRCLNFQLASDTSAKQLYQLAMERGLTPQASDDYADLFHRLWVAVIDPDLNQKSEPIAVTEWPKELAALARINASGWADRIELYWRGLEIANGFAELNDPIEQERRFASDLVVREKLGRTRVPVDEEFVKALRSGMPPATGIALGLERLFMACQKIEKIQDLRAFPWRSEKDTP